MTDRYSDGRIYDRLFEQCTTQNQLGQMQINLENRLTPAETAGLAAHIQAHYTEGPVRRRITWLRIERDRRRNRELVIGAPRTAPRYLRAVQATQWAGVAQRQLELSGRPPAPVDRVWARRGATLYRSRVDGPRTLLVAFSGNLRGFMMPTQLFLQFVGERPVDVLKLEVPRGAGYGRGVQPFSHDFPSTLGWVGRLTAEGVYARTVTVGTSGGGGPALLAAAQLGADAAFAAGPARNTADELATQLGAESVADVLSGMSDRCEVTLVYGERSSRDTETVELLGKDLPAARIVRVADADHACLYDLVEREQFSPLVATAILGERDREPA